MSCNLHHYEGNLPCPWPECRNGFPGQIVQRRELPALEELGCLIADSPIPVMRSIKVATFERERWGVSFEGQISQSFIWRQASGPPPSQFENRLHGKPWHLIYTSSIAKWIESATAAKLAPYQTLDTRTVDEIVLDAIGPWIGFAVMVGTLLIAWFNGPGARS